VAMILPVLNAGAVLCVDELDTSLHPHLALETIRMFQDPVRNPKHAQLLFNTHDTVLLGNLAGGPHLRRDQVWFVEKDGEGATHLYPLTDFKPRKDENLERGYLQGRYGAIPFVEPPSAVEFG
jgi:AAA15 family ATPase/GTPase